MSCGKPRGLGPALVITLTLASSVSLAQQPQQLPPEASFTAGRQQVLLEVARTPAQQSVGLMYRTGLDPNRGMLFPYSPPRLVNFWMKNVPFGLDLVFMRNGVIQGITAAAPCRRDPCPLYPSPGPVDQVVELAAGRAEALGLRLGQSLEIRPHSSPSSLQDIKERP
ncbi:MAG: DUF192 domain-containing protein [Gloeomargaritaceae cyanobacterium C42_A2020_066]|nr:DUF192 domain-containing protein [Gloeomargaritaceae cyanobacterium C42_A2020_066]